MFFYKIVYCLILSLFKAQISEISGLENLPKDRGFIIAANHVSVYDPLVIVASLKNFLWQYFTPQRKKVYFIGDARLRRKIFRYHFVSFLLLALGVKVGYLPANRPGLERAFSELEKGNIVAIFPEGKQNSKTQLLRGHKGVAVLALLSGAIVIPTGCFGPVPAKKVRQFFKGWFEKKQVVFGKGFSFNRITRDKIGENPGLLRSTTDFIMQKIADVCGKEYLFGKTI